MRKLIELRVNGSVEELYVEPWWMLAAVLRDELGLTGTKISCGAGDCGACTVIIDGRAVKSCIYPVMKAQGKEISTIEGVAGQDGKLHPLQQAFVDNYAVQCGFCTPGMVMAAKALLGETPHPTEEEVREGMAGNLCRCTGYKRIFEAVTAVANATESGS
jgi:carbon-monoxide dehydrogenase small subunit